MAVINDSQWKDLTNHQKSRYIDLTNDTQLMEIDYIIGSLKKPFDRCEITWHICEDAPYTLIVHAMKLDENYPGCTF